MCEYAFNSRDEMKLPAAGRVALRCVALRPKSAKRKGPIAKWFEASRFLVVTDS